MAEPDVVALAQALAGGRSVEIDQMFARAGAGRPLVVWEPRRHELGHPTLRAFESGLRRAAGAAGAVRLDAFEALDLGAVADWLMVVEPLPDEDFLYLRYGEGIACEYGRDMTGARSSDFGGHIGAFFRALYVASARLKRPVLSVHEPPAAVFVSAWRRLIVPLLDADGRVVRLAAANAPDNDLRAGLEAIPEAVMVTTPEGRVMFANAVARMLFGDRRLPRDGLSLSEFTGLDVDLPTCEAAREIEGVGRQDDLIVHFNATCKRIEYRDRAYYVVMLRFT